MTIALLLNVSSLVAALVGVGCGIAGIAGGICATYFLLSKKIGKTKANAAKIIEEAYAEAKTAKKEAILEAKEEIHKMRADLDREVKDRRNEIQRSEDRISQREEFVEKKELSLDKKQEQIDEMKEKLQAKENEIEKLHEEENKIILSMRAELEKVSRMTKEEAKQSLINSLVDEAKLDAAKEFK